MRFDVSGTITLRDHISHTTPNVTLDGSSTTISINPLSPRDVEATVLANVGATLPCRDSVDVLIVTTVQTRTGKDVATGGNVFPATPLPDPPVCEPPHP